MEKETKYKIYLQNENSGEIFSTVFDYAQIFFGCAKIQLSAYFEPCKVIGKAESTGKKYKDESEIFDGDITEDSDGSKYIIQFHQDTLQYWFDGITNSVSTPLWRIDTTTLKNVGSVKIEQFSTKR